MICLKTDPYNLFNYMEKSSLRHFLLEKGIDKEIRVTMKRIFFDDSVYHDKNGGLHSVDSIRRVINYCLGDIRIGCDCCCHLNASGFNLNMTKLMFGSDDSQCILDQINKLEFEFDLSRVRIHVPFGEDLHDAYQYIKIDNHFITEDKEMIRLIAKFYKKHENLQVTQTSCSYKGEFEQRNRCTGTVQFIDHNECDDRGFWGRPVDPDMIPSIRICNSCFNWLLIVSPEFNKKKFKEYNAIQLFWMDWIDDTVDSKELIWHDPMDKQTLKELFD